MTLSIHWDDVRPGAKVVSRARARKAAAQVIGFMATMAGIAVVMAGLVAIRIYAFVPGPH